MRGRSPVVPFALTALLLIAGTALAQIRPALFTATLDGAALPAPVATEGWGSVTALLLGDELTVAGFYRDLGSPLPTLHGMPRGVNIRLDDGPAVRLRAPQRVLGSGLTMSLAATGGTDGSFHGVFALSAEQLEQLESGRFHVQLYTLDHPTGELRGRLLPEVEADVGREDLIGVWRAEGQGVVWQYYASGHLVHLASAELAGRHLQPDQTWELDGDVLTLRVGGRCSGDYTFVVELLTDGRHRLFPLSGGAGRCAPSDLWSYYRPVAR